MYMIDDILTMRIIFGIETRYEVYNILYKRYGVEPFRLLYALRGFLGQTIVDNEVFWDQLSLVMIVRRPRKG